MTDVRAQTEGAFMVSLEDLDLVTTAQLQREISALEKLLIQRIEALSDLHDEKFAGVQMQFRERDISVAATLQATREAVSKQEEAGDRAITKSEAATTKQIDQILLLIASNGKAADDKISDLKEKRAGSEGSSIGRRDSWGWLVGAVGLVAGLIGILAYVSKP